MTNAIIDSLSLRNRATASCVGDRPATFFASASWNSDGIAAAWLSNSEAGMVIVTSLKVVVRRSAFGDRPHAVRDSM